MTDCPLPEYQTVYCSSCFNETFSGSVERDKCCYTEAVNDTMIITFTSCYAFVNFSYKLTLPPDICHLVHKSVQKCLLKGQVD